MATDIDIPRVIGTLESHSIDPDAIENDKLLKLVRQHSYVDTRFGEYDGRQVQHNVGEFAIEVRKVEHVVDLYYAELETEERTERFVLEMDDDEKDEFAKELTDIEHVAIFLQ